MNPTLGGFLEEHKAVKMTSPLFSLGLQVGGSAKEKKQKVKGIVDAEKNTFSKVRKTNKQSKASFCLNKLQGVKLFTEQADSEDKEAERRVTVR